MDRGTLPHYTDLVNNNIIICYVSQLVLHAHVAAASNKVHSSTSVDSTATEIVDRFIKLNWGYSSYLYLI